MTTFEIIILLFITIIFVFLVFVTYKAYKFYNLWKSEERKSFDETNKLIKLSQELQQNYGNINLRNYQEITKLVTNVTREETRDICKSIEDLKNQIANFKLGLSAALNDSNNKNTLESQKNRESYKRSINTLDNRINQLDISLNRYIGEIITKLTSSFDNQRYAYSNMQSSLNTTIKNMGSELTRESKISDELHRQAIMQLSEKINGLDVSLQRQLNDYISSLKIKEKDRKAYLDSAFGQVDKQVTNLSSNVSELHASWHKCIPFINHLEDLIKQTNLLNQKILNICSGVENQEHSLSAMVEKHVEIARLTNEMNQTAKDVFELLKLSLLSSIVDHTKFQSR